MPSVILRKRPTIFICEPDCNDSHTLADHLKKEDFCVSCISESSQAVDQIITRVPDVVLLDAQIPVAGGYDVCKAVRPHYSGTIVFQGKDADDAAQLLAYERGADDYIITPVSPAVLTAKINVCLRRSSGSSGKRSGAHIKVGELVVDASRREVFLAGQPVDLTTMQFELLWYLAKRSGRVVPRQELYEALYNQKYNGFDRSVDVYISRIRQQLGDDAEKPSYVKTIRGVGYLFAGHDGYAS